MRLTHDMQNNDLAPHLSIKSSELLRPHKIHWLQSVKARCVLLPVHRITAPHIAKTTISERNIRCSDELTRLYEALGLSFYLWSLESENFEDIHILKPA